MRAGAHQGESVERVLRARDPFEDLLTTKDTKVHEGRLFRVEGFVILLSNSMTEEVSSPSVPFLPV